MVAVERVFKLPAYRPILIISSSGLSNGPVDVTCSISLPCG